MRRSTPYRQPVRRASKTARHVQPPVTAREEIEGEQRPARLIRKPYNLTPRAIQAPMRVVRACSGSLHSTDNSLRRRRHQIPVRRAAHPPTSLHLSARTVRSDNRGPAFRLRHCDLRPRRSYVSPRMSGAASPGLAVASHLHERQRPIGRSNVWRQQAQATLAKAESFDCLRSKAKLLKILEEYQKLERWADERERLRRDADEER